MPEALSRVDASAAGATRYFTGLACKRGHVAYRMVSTRACVDCLAQHTRAWRKANPDKVNEQKRNWCRANPARVKASKAADQIRNRKGATQRSLRYRLAHLERTRLATATWQAANPGKVNAKAARRRAALLQRTPPWANHDATAGMYELAAVFRRTGLEMEVDHDFPLQGRAVSGLHVADNLRLITSSANKAKSNRFAGI